MSKGGGSQTVTQDIDPAVKPYRDTYLRQAFNYASNQPLRFFGFPGWQQRSFMGINNGGTPGGGGGGGYPPDLPPQGPGNPNPPPGMGGGGAGGNGGYNPNNPSGQGNDPFSNPLIPPGTPHGHGYFDYGNPGGNVNFGFGPLSAASVGPDVGPNGPGGMIPDSWPGGGGNPGGGGYGSGYDTYQGPDPFSVYENDPTVAALDPMMGQAAGIFGSLASNQTPGMASRISEFLNPYTKEVVDATRNDFAHQRGVLNAQVDDLATKEHAFGGSRHGVLSANAMDDLARNEASTLAGLRYGGFQTALGAAGQDRSMDLADRAGRLSAATSLYGAGRDKTARRQATIDAASSRFNQAQNYGLQNLGIMQNAITGIPMGMTTSQPTQSNWLSQLMGLGLSAAGIYKGFR